MNCKLKQMEENTLYYTEDYVKGKLIELDKNITIKDYKEVSINGSILRDMLNNNISSLGHRCMSVYRHSFILNGHVYNICLSCGDFYRDDKHYYINNEEQIKEYISEVISAEKE